MIIPELGGFVTQYVSAIYENSSDMFLPPTRSIGFNPSLTMNDGLLVESLMETYGSSYPEMNKEVHMSVCEIKTNLREEGQYDFQGVGKLSRTSDGHYDFTPSTIGLISPTLYGLTSYSFDNASNHKEQQEELENLEVAENVSEKTYTLHINREIVNYITAAAVALLFYFAWATPAIDVSGRTSQKASISIQQFLTSVRQKASEVKQMTISPVSSSKVSETAVATETEIPENETAASPTEDAYTIVLASAVGKAGATELVEKMNNDGSNRASVFMDGTMRRVIYGNYSTETEANAELSNLKKTGKVKDAWVMKF